MSIWSYRTKTGRALTDADFEEMAAAAERGYELGDPCPQCGEADLEPFGAKRRCPECGFLQPCCQP